MSFNNYTKTYVYNNNTLYSTPTNKVTVPISKSHNRKNIKTSKPNRKNREFCGSMENGDLTNEELNEQIDDIDDRISTISEKRMNNIMKREWAIRMNTIAPSNSDSDE